MGQAAELSPVKLSFSIPSEIRELYMYVSRPVFMEEWFADEVDIEEINGEIIYIFQKDGETLKAKMIEKVPNKLIKFRWIEHPTKKGQNLIFQIIPPRNEGDNTKLFIFDACDQLKIKLIEKYWNNEIEKLLKAIE